MYFTNEVLKRIKDTVGALEAESGGIIAINQNGIVSDYYFDFEAGFGKTSYIPSRSSIQNHIRNNWSSTMLKFCGVVHSHPLCNTCEPSYIDIDMALKIMTINNMDKFYLLMVKGSEIRLYCVTNPNSQRKPSCVEEEIEVTDMSTFE